MQPVVPDIDPDESARLTMGAVRAVLGESLEQSEVELVRQMNEPDAVMQAHQYFLQLCGNTPASNEVFFSAWGLFCAALVMPLRLAKEKEAASANH